MALKRINAIYYMADEYSDLASITNPGMGTECFVIADACEYKATSDGRWFKQIPSTNINTGDMPTITVEDIDKIVKEAEESFNAQHRPIKYEISNTPVGTIVDYREKEVRVFCPTNVVFTKQTVGENGNPNMYYMTFKAYAPKGAVSFKEGDRGTIIDTMYDFNDTAAGTDKYGRNYSVCWLALASYDATTDSWNYFGKTSTTEKYIGWTYIVEWYDKNGIMIGTDKIRINLSNENCHLD